MKKQTTYKPKSYELDDSSSDSRGPQLTSNFFNVPKRSRYSMSSATDKPNLPPQYKQNEYALQQQYASIAMDSLKPMVQLGDTPVIGNGQTLVADSSQIIMNTQAAGITLQADTS